MSRKVPAHAWLPRLGRDAPVPPTLLLPCDAAKVLRASRRLCMAPLRHLIDQVREASRRIGYPVFVRHEGGTVQDIELCVARDEEELARAVPSALSAPGSDASCHLLVRTYVPLVAPMQVPGGRNVTREFEVHADSGTVHCIHPAWKGAIPIGGEQVFARLYALSVDDQAAITAICRRAASGLKGGWRLDVAQTARGSWCILGMDRAKMCPRPAAPPSFVKL